jgi:hypothetical protein
MMEYYKLTELDSLIKSKNYINVDKDMPRESGAYDVIWQVGSMSPKLREGEALFRRGQFSRYDWNYVVAWRKK